MGLDELINQGNELRDTELGSSNYAVWRNDVRAAVAPHGTEMTKVLEGALYNGVIIMGRRNTNDKAIDSTIELLETLKKRQPADSRAQAAMINLKTEEARHTLRAKFGSTTINATNVTLGDNSPISQVQVGEFLAALIEQVEQKLPDSEEKTKLLDHLKSVLANPAFVAVAAATVPEVLKRLMGVS